MMGLNTEALRYVLMPDALEKTLVVKTSKLRQDLDSLRGIRGTACISIALSTLASLAALFSKTSVIKWGGAGIAILFLGVATWAIKEAYYLAIAILKTNKLNENDSPSSH